MSASRKTARDALTALLSDALVGTGLPVQAIYGYQKGDFDGQSPVVLVLSGGSEREPFALNATHWENEFVFEVLVFVADADGSSWTDEDVENKVDEIEAIIAATVASNRKTTNWSMLDYAEKTAVSSVTIAGNPYKMEVIPLKVSVIEL